MARVQILPTTLQGYIIVLIKESYYEPAGAQWHRTEWKTDLQDFHFSGPSEQYSRDTLSTKLNEAVLQSCCDISAW